MQIEAVDFKTLNLLTAEQAHKFKVIPAHAAQDTLHVFAPEGSPFPQSELEFLLGTGIHPEWVDPDLFEKQLNTYYPFSLSRMEKSKADLREESDVIRFVRKVFEEAAAMGASDIHIERYESYARIRFRWEGQLIEKYEVPAGQYNAVVSRIKILSELDIAERRLPQDGRIHIESQSKKIDMRVSTLPGRYGEKVVLRLLTRSQSFLDLQNLGMLPAEYERLSLSLKHSGGIILITGPTGSGKTTTLYAALSRLNQPMVNISTIEDPIEYNIEGINQVQVKDEIGLSFERTLRALLRQDPNVIMIGEIRDKTTAEIAIRAALTGHLVFSTLHTNSSWDAVTRLIDMGVEPYLLAASIRLLAAQRLLRVLCPHCRQLSEELEFPQIQQQENLHQHYVPQGCPACHYTGYTRRKAIYEVIPLNRELCAKIKNLDLDIEPYLQENDIKTLREHVLELIRKGETSLEEGAMYLI